MVTVEDAELAPANSVAGEKLQFKLLGRPAQESEIAWLRTPDWAIAVTVKLPEFPAGIVRVDGVAAKDTAGPPVALAPHPGV